MPALLQHDDEPRVRVNVLQIAGHGGADCGVTLFAARLEAQLRRTGLRVETAAQPRRGARPDLVLVHDHEELIEPGTLRALARDCGAPAVLFAHSEASRPRCEAFAACVAMCCGMVAPVRKPVHVFAHPAWTPGSLEDRVQLRRELGWPEARAVVATHGYLKFERQFAEIAEALLPEAVRHEWLVHIVASPWRLDSPGLLARLRDLQRRYPDHFALRYGFLDERALNRRLQACDLLWCWTTAASSPYASGVISDQYASGTRIVAADKTQHEHVLALPNVVASRGGIDAFVDTLSRELREGRGERHDPSPVSWDNCIGPLAGFLKTVAASGAARAAMVKA